LHTILTIGSVSLLQMYWCRKSTIIAHKSLPIVLQVKYNKYMRLQCPIYLNMSHVLLHIQLDDIV